MKIKDYSIIETEWLEELKSMYLKHNKECEQDSPNEFHSNCGKIFLIEMLQSKLKPLTPIVENAFSAGDLYGRNDMAFSCGRIGRIEAESTYNKEEYINNTIIE